MFLKLRLEVFQFADLNSQLLVVNYFHKKVPSWFLDVLNTPLFKVFHFLERENWIFGLILLIPLYFLKPSKTTDISQFTFWRAVK